MTEGAIEDHRSLGPTLRFEKRLRAFELEQAFRRLEQYHRAGDRKSEGHMLGQIATALQKTGRVEVALVYYTGALAAFREVGDRRCEGTTFANSAGALETLGHLRDALDRYRQARDIARELGDRNAECMDTDSIANVLVHLGFPQAGLEHHQQARQLAAELGEARIVLLTTMNEGGALQALEQSEEALARYSEGLELAWKLEDHRAIAACLSNIGNILDGRGQHEEALQHYEYGIALNRELEDREGQAVGLVNVAGTLNSMGRSKEALNRYGEALRLFRAVGRKDGESTCLRGIADIYEEEGRSEEAIGLQLQALALARASEDAWGQLRSLSDIAPILHSEGKPQEALECHHQALQMARRLGEREAEAMGLASIAAIQAELQQHDQALLNLEQALETMRELGVVEAEVALLNRLAELHLQQASHEKSLALLREAQGLAEATGEPVLEAGALAGLGDLALRRGQPEEAISHLTKALSVYRNQKMQSQEAWCLQSLGHAHRAQGHKDKALDLYRQAFTLVEGARDKRAMQNVLANLGRLCAERRELERAKAYFEAATELIETYRSQYSDERDRIAFFSGWVNVYSSQLAVLYELSSEEEGERSAELMDATFLCAERSRARTFVESLERLRIGSSGPQGEHYRNLAAVQKSATRRLEQLSELHAAALSKADLGEAPRNDADLLGQQVEAAEEEIQASLDTAKALEARIRREDPRLAALTDAGSAIGLDTVRDELVDEDTVLFHFTFAGDLCIAFGLTKEVTGLASVSPRGIIEQQVRELRLAVTQGWERGLRSYPHGYELYRLLIGPMADHMEGKSKLLIVPDGVLSDLPFTLLLERPPEGRDEEDATGGEQFGESGDEVVIERLLEEDTGEFDWPRLPYLGRSHSIRYLPSATAAVLGLREPERDLRDCSPPCVCAAPLTTEPESAAANTEFLPLRWVGSEIEAVRQLFEQRGLAAVIEPAASREVILARADEGARLLWHLACHCRVDELDPELSRLVLEPALGEDEPSLLGLAEILDVSMPCELAVLSACDTAHGRFVPGEGMLAFSRAFMAAGARSVCASFWPVHDPSAPQLMEAFYKHLLEPGCTREDALARAQRQMLEGPFAHPYHWASFGIWGDGGEIPLNDSAGSPALANS